MYVTNVVVIHARWRSLNKGGCILENCISIVILQEVKIRNIISLNVDSLNNIPIIFFVSNSQSKETTTMGRSSTMDSFDMSSRVLMPSPTCRPRLQTPPLTARVWTPTEEKSAKSSQKMRKHTPAQSSGEPCLLRWREWWVILHQHLRRTRPLHLQHLDYTPGRWWKMDF